MDVAAKESCTRTLRVDSGVAEVGYTCRAVAA